MALISKITNLFQKKEPVKTPTHNDHYASYFCRVNDHLASIFINLGLKEIAPLTEKPYLLWVWIYFKEPREDGLSASSEAPALFALEDKLQLHLANACQALPCGKITTLGRREFYYYAPSEVGFAQAVRDALVTLDGYAFDIGSQIDTTWAQYLDVLYPSPDALDSIANSEVLDNLKKNGDIHSIPRNVDHWIFLPSKDTANAFRQAAEALGFLFVSQTRIDGPLPFSIHLARIQPVEQDQIDTTTRELRQLSEQFQGDYDGWEAPATDNA